MNSVILAGRMTRDAEERQEIVSFTLAVDRRTKGREADFIRCTAFGSTAEFIAKYFKKGDGMTIRGHIKTGSYEGKDGTTVWTTDVIVDECEFPLSNKKEEPEPAPANKSYRR